MKEVNAAPATGPPHVDPERDARAQLFNARGAVRRTCDRFEVTPPSVEESPPSFTVWRDAEGRVHCSCEDYVNAGLPAFRCEHILAVKHFLLAKPAPPYRKPEGLDAGREAAPLSVADYRKNQRSIRMRLVHAAALAAELLGHGASPDGRFRQGMPEVLLHTLQECGDIEAARLAAESFLEKHGKIRTAT